jgi:hypothetical protein
MSLAARKMRMLILWRRSSLMLTDLSWIADGKPWPPEDADEKARLAEHALNRQIYCGLHDRIFPRYIAYLADASKDAKKQAIILDWPELATSSYLNLLLGEEPEVIAGERKDLPERPDEQVFIDVSRYGIGLYEISDAGIQALNPENCYIVVTPGSIQKPWAFVFFQTFKQTEGSGSDKKEHEYVKFTIHTQGQIQHLVFEIAKDQTIQISGTESIVKGPTLSGPKDLKNFPQFKSLEVDSQGIQSPSADDILIVPVQNQLSSERYYGRSDYKPSIVSLIESLELSFAQRDEVLAKFTNPTPVVPESATVFDHKTQEWIYRPGKPIIMSPGESTPSLMVWQAELGAVERAIEQKMDQLLQMLQLSRVLLAGSGQGQAESGTALRIRLIPTLAKVSKYARAAEQAIPKVLALWSQLHPPEIPLQAITVNLQDGIPEDPMETAQAALLWEQMGAISLERKLILQGLKEGSEAFDTELERLKASAPSTPEVPQIELPPMGE